MTVFSLFFQDETRESSLIRIVTSKERSLRRYVKKVSTLSFYVFQNKDEKMYCTIIFVKGIMTFGKRLNIVNAICHKMLYVHNKSIKE